MDRIRTAVIGAGYLGKYHIQKFYDAPHSTLVAICDIDFQRLQALSQEYSLELTDNYKTLLGKVEAVSIVTPTPSHFEIGRFFLENGVHVFIEKPIATTLQEADILVSLAERKQLILQCGHIERFNPAFQYILPHLSNPSFIEIQRLAPFKLRCSDVSVVLDLMIHDIDLVLASVKSKIVALSATGSSVLTAFLDVVNVKINFENGCVASLTASRINEHEIRCFRVFQKNDSYDVDLKKNSVTIHKKNDSLPHFSRKTMDFEKTDVLRSEIEDFLKTIVLKRVPTVSGFDARNALSVAIKIHESIQLNQESLIS